MLYELIKPYSSVSLIGMCKNAGKTTVLNRLIKDCRRMDESIALTSIGRDGERSDLVTNTKKPEIFVYDGTIIATAEKLLFAGGNLSDSGNDAQKNGMNSGIPEYWTQQECRRLWERSLSFVHAVTALFSLRVRP